MPSSPKDLQIIIIIIWRLEFPSSRNQAWSNDTKELRKYYEPHNHSQYPLLQINVTLELAGPAVLTTLGRVQKGQRRKGTESGAVRVFVFLISKCFFFWILLTVLFLKLSFSYFSPNIASAWIVPCTHQLSCAGRFRAPAAVTLAAGGVRLPRPDVAQGRSPRTVLAVVRHECKGHLSPITLRWLTDLAFGFRFVFLNV